MKYPKKRKPIARVVAYDEGYQAYKDEVRCRRERHSTSRHYGKTFSNPYTAVGEEFLWSEWQRGYSDAQWDYD